MSDKERYLKKDSSGGSQHTRVSVRTRKPLPVSTPGTGRRLTGNKSLKSKDSSVSSITKGTYSGKLPGVHTRSTIPSSSPLVVAGPVPGRWSGPGPTPPGPSQPSQPQPRPTSGSAGIESRKKIGSASIGRGGQMKPSVKVGPAGTTSAASQVPQSSPMSGIVGKRSGGVIRKPSSNKIAKAQSPKRRRLPGRSRKGRRSGKRVGRRSKLTVSSSKTLTVSLAELESSQSASSDVKKKKVEKVKDVPIDPRLEATLLMQCPRCLIEVKPVVIGEPSKYTHLIAAIFCLLCLTPCMFMPYWFSCKTTPVKRCRKCGAYLTEPPLRCQPYEETSNDSDDD